MTFKYFLLLCRLYFHFDSVQWYTKVLNLHRVQFVYFFLLLLVLLVSVIYI